MIEIHSTTWLWFFLVRHWSHVVQYDTYSTDHKGTTLQKSRIHLGMRIGRFIVLNIRNHFLPRSTRKRAFFDWQLGTRLSFFFLVLSIEFWVLVIWPLVEDLLFKWWWWGIIRTPAMLKNCFLYLLQRRVSVNGDFHCFDTFCMCYVYCGILQACFNHFHASLKLFNIKFNKSIKYLTHTMSYLSQ